MLSLPISRPHEIFDITPSARLATLLSATLFASTAALAAPITLVQAGKLLDKPGQSPRGATTLVIENGKIKQVLEGHVGAEGALAYVNTNAAAWAYEAEQNARKTLNAGFTTVRNLGDGPDGITLALRDAINKGWVQGPPHP